MDDKNRDQQSQSTGNEQSNTGSQQSGQGEQQNASNEQDQNPPLGGSWNNYRTREMGNEQDSGNSGSSEDSGGGGTMY
ncbi:MAG: hypothetical protein JWR72_3561 [Flavisolibacter sp.]|nr:hypothetical protein [Flavisolibacter sp.]